MKRLVEFYNRRDNYAKTFGTPEGKAVLADIYRAAGLDRPSYVEGKPDRTAYNEGLKRIGLRIKNILDHSDEQIKELAAHYERQSTNYTSVYKQ